LATPQCCARNLAPAHRPRRCGTINGDPRLRKRETDVVSVANI